jgi:hypothetical protein
MEETSVQGWAGLSLFINVSGKSFKIRHVQLPVIQKWGAYIAPGMS